MTRKCRRTKTERLEMHCKPLIGTEEIGIHFIHGTKHMEYWPSCHVCLPYSNTANWLILAQRKKGPVLRYNETSAWSRKGSWLVDYKRHFKGKKAKTGNVTYRIVNLVYSLLGSISRPFSSTSFTKSKVDRTDAAVSVRVEWARCFPGQILPERWWH